MDCETALELLCASLDGELTADQEAQLQAHLEQCPDCRALYAQLSGIHAACAQLDAAPPAELTQRIMENLPPQRVSKTHYWRRWAALAASLVLVATAVWKTSHLLTRDPGPTSDAGPAADLSAQKREEVLVPSGVADAPLPDYVEGQAVSANSAPTALSDDDLEAPTQGRAAQAPEDRTAYGTEAAPVYTGAAQKSAAPSQSSPAPTPAAGGGAVSTEGAEESLEGSQADGDIAPQSMEITPRSFMLTPPGSEDSGEEPSAVPETPPEFAPGEEDIPAVPFEKLTEVDDRDFSLYRGVLTLTHGAPEGEYHRQLQENGDMWYLLPWEDFTALLQELDQQGAAYELRDQGEDVTPDAPQGLLIVPAQGQ